MSADIRSGVLNGQVNGAYAAFVGLKRQSNGTFTRTGLGDRVDAILLKSSDASGDFRPVRLLADLGEHTVLLSGTSSAGALAYPAASGKFSTTPSGRAVGRFKKTGADGDETTMDGLGRGEIVSAVNTTDKTTTYTAANGETVLCDPSGAGFTVNLPPAVAGDADIVIKNNTTSTNAITIDPDSAETVEGASTISIAASRGVRTLRPMAGKWILIGN